MTGMEHTEPGERIIEHDIRFYEAEIEFCQQRERRAPQVEHAYWVCRRTAAERVYTALQNLRSAMDCKRTG